MHWENQEWKPLSIITNVTVIAVVISWILGEELKILRAGGSAGMPLLILEPSDGSLYCKR